MGVLVSEYGDYMIEYMMQGEVVAERIGDSLGFQLPKEVVEKEHIQENQKIKIIIPQHNKTKERIVFLLVP